MNKVANPQDILIFSKHAQRKAAQQKENKDPEMTLDGLRPEELDQSRIEDLVAENLGPGGSLEVFDEQELQEALHKFVDKDDRHALDECVKDMLLRFQVRSGMDSGAAAHAAAPLNPDPYLLAVLSSDAPCESWPWCEETFVDMAGEAGKEQRTTPS